MFLPSSVRIAIYINLCSFPISDGRQRKKPLHPPKTHSFRKNSFISLSRLFPFSNALIRFFSCWFSSAIFRDSSRLRSPQPISRLPILAFLIQPYSVFTGIWSSFAAFTAPIFFCKLYCLHFVLIFILFIFWHPFFLHFFLFLFYSFEIRVSSFIILHHTTTSIYCHVFNQAQARAGDAIASVLDFKKHDTNKGQPEAV